MTSSHCLNPHDQKNHTCDSEICNVVLCAIVANSCALLDRKFNKVKCAILELKVTNLSVTNLTVLNFP